MAKRKAAPEAENVSGYFRKIFTEKPSLLTTRSNAELVERWLQDHPDDKEVPKKAQQALSNVKSLMRKKLRKRGKKKAAVQPAEAATPTIAAVARPSVKGLEGLEVDIDEVLTKARNLDREGLADVIGLLRKARNSVVWRIGE